jgi:putative flippase GtrA
MKEFLLRIIALINHRSNKLPIQAVRYFFVALAGFLTDYIALFLLNVLLGMHYLAATAIAYAAGTVVNYVLGLAFVFERGRMRRALEIFLFILIAVIAFGLTEFIMWLLSDAIAGIHPLLSKIVAAFFSFLWNFFARRYILYRAVK